MVSIVALALAITVLPVIVSIFRALKTAAAQPRGIPGPFLARFTRLWYFRGVVRGDFEHRNLALHRYYAERNNSNSTKSSQNKYLASIVRIGPNMYSIAEAPKNVYGISSKMEKSSWYDGWLNPKNDQQSVFTHRNIAKHAELRRKLQNTYSLSSIVSYETPVDECGAIFQDRLRELATTKLHHSNDRGYVDLGYWLQCYAFDVIGVITYSKRFGFLDAGNDIHGLIELLDMGMKYSTLVGIYAWLSPYIFRAISLLPESPARTTNKVFSFAADLQKERKEQKLSRMGKGQNSLNDPERKQAPDLLDKLLALQLDEKRDISDGDVMSAGLQNIGAGSDTTAASFSAILYYLIKNPACMAKLRAEIAAKTNEGLCETHRVSFKAGQEMPYLQAVIKEGLRLHAAVGLPLWRVVGKGGAKIMDQWLPEGSEIGVNAWVAHYNRDVWGDDVDQFRPERWLEAEKDRDKLRELEANYLPFGLGSRTCIGKHISLLEITKMLPQIVRNFDFELEHPDRNWTNLNFWFVKPHDFFVKVKLLESTA